MAFERISQILPTVKCSDCGRDVEIRRLGEHLCSSLPPVPSIPIIPTLKDKNKLYNQINQSNHPTDGLISPLQSPKYNATKKNDFYQHTPPAGSVTPPYHSGRDLQRPLIQTNNYTDDSYSDDFYKQPFSQKSNSNTSLPRKNSNTHVSTSPTSFRNYSDDSHSEYRYERKDSLGNIHQQPSSSFALKNSSGALDNLMADLMSSINDDLHLSNPTSSANKKQSTCSFCREEFDYRDEVKSLNQKSYHKACYTCRLCSASFDSRRTPFEHEGKLYCERDYHVVKNRVMCASCDRIIPPSVTPIKALGKYYHPGHVKCYHCYDPIDERTGWKEYQGRLYCRSDFKMLFLPKCRSCHKPVETQAVSAMDGKLKGKWHLECFGCHTCHRPFPDNTFYVYDDAPYCKRHYHELNGSLCRNCNIEIEGQCLITAENWKFHPRCFGCSICNCPITDTYYMFERKVYCEAHIRQLQRQRNIRAEKRRTHFGHI